MTKNRYAQFGVVAVLGVLCWLALTRLLWIAPVWDEQGMIDTVRNAQSLPRLFHGIWFQYLAYRPLSKSLVFPVLYFVHDKTLAWQVMRGINAALLLGATVFYLAFLRRLLRPALVRDSLLVLVVLFSPAMLMVAAWGANLFDASAWFFLALGLWLLGREQHSLATLNFALAFFCKEIAVLIFPFLFYWWLSGRMALRDFVRTNIALACFFALYLVLRSRVVELGGSGDIHGFSPGQWPYAIHLYVSTMWQQTNASLPYLGWLVLGLVLWLLRRSAPALLGVSLLTVASAVLYQGMPHLGPAAVITPAVFQSRLYLVPSLLLLSIVLLHTRPSWLPLLLLLPLQISGLAWQFAGYRDFQNVYAGIEQRAKVLGRPLHIQGEPGVQLAIWQTPQLAYRIWLPGKAPAHVKMDFRLDNRSGELVPLH